MQCTQADYCENGAPGSSSSLWTFKLEFGIVHTVNCSVCRSYMTHVAVANHSGDASFKDALNNREDRVSTAFLDGLQGGRQIQKEHDSPVLSRYRNERDKALQDVDDAKKEMAILRDRIVALELAAQDPASERVSKRRDEATSSNTKSPAKSDMSSVEHLLLSPSEDLDALSTPFLSTADDHDPTSIPNLPTPAEDREALQTETLDPIKSLGHSLASVEPLGETIVSTENVLQSSALLLNPSSFATPEPAKPSPQPSTSSLNLSNSYPSDQSFATLDAAKPSPQLLIGALNLSNPSPSDQPSSPIEPLVSTTKVPESWALLAKASSSAAPKPEKLSPRSSSSCVHSSLNPSNSDQQSLSAEPPGETNVSTAKVPKSWAQLAKASTSATPKPEKPLPQLSACALSSSNTSDQLPAETNVSTSKMPKSWAQLAKASTSATSKPEKPSSQPPICILSSSNTSDQQPLSLEPPPGETNVSTAKVPKSWAQLAKASSSATPKLEKPSPRQSTCALDLSNPSSSDQQSSSLLTSLSPPLTTIARVEALMKSAHSGDDSSLTRIRAFCGTARRTPRKQRTELQRYALLHWRKPSPSVSSSVPSSVTSSEPGIVHTTLGDGMFSTEIHVDSSAWGIGFVMDGLWLAWKFSDSLTLFGNSIDNNWAEMLAVEVGLWTVIHWVRSVIQKEGDVIESLEIIVCSDNAGVVKAIEKRHSNSPPQQDILVRILEMASEYDIQLSMKWISSIDNFADGPSRGVPGPAPDILPFIPPLPSYLSDTLLLP